MASKRDKQCGLGKALKNRLQKKKFVGNSEKVPIFYQQTEENQAQKKKMKMKSIIEQNSLNDFLQVAELSQQDFHANRNTKFKEIREELTNKKIINIHDSTKRKPHIVPKNILLKLQVPRRPEWKKAKNKQQFQKWQNQAYLNWRRRLANVQQSNENISITPYEKNIEVWRQLWRVVERAQVLVQIVDGRNPLFFYSEDLVEYAKQVDKNKRFLIVINKSDLLPLQTRKQWNNFFINEKIDHCFFSAKQITEPDSTENQTTIQSETEDSQIEFNAFINKEQVLSPSQLIALFQNYTQSLDSKQVEVGLVGYPNVGKSSVINTLLGKKKVGVASMPGKTKHFQTLKLSQTITLCDCPGLVFPRVSENQAELVLNGLYPLDTIKKYDDPMQILAYRIPKQQIEELYALHWKQDEPYDAETILNKYAKLKGMYTGSGLPNQSMSSRQILKDYVNGVIIYVHKPPSTNENAHQEQEKNLEQYKSELHQQKMNFIKKQQNIQKQLDEDFFQKDQKETRNIQQIISSFTDEDLLDLMDGKKIGGLKITKQIRKSIKFALKRNDNLDKIKSILLAQLSVGKSVGWGIATAK